MRNGQRHSDCREFPSERAGSALVPRGPLCEGLRLEWQNPAAVNQRHGSPL